MKFKLGFSRKPVPLGPVFYANKKSAPRNLAKFFIPFFAVLLAVFVGLASAVLPWQFLVGFASLPLLLLVGIAFPLPVFGVALLLMFGIVPEFIMAALPLGGANLRPPEILLIFLALLVVFRAWSSGFSYIEHLHKIRWLLLVLIAGVAVGFLKGKLISHNTLAMADARQFVGWLALPVAVWFAHTKFQAFQRLVVGLALLASILMIAQLVFGVQLIYGFRGAEDLSTDFKDITRSAIGGGLFFLAYAAYYFFLSSCQSEKYRWLNILACIVVVGGLVSSFNRAIWAGFVLGALVLLFIKPVTKRGVGVSLFSLVFMGVLAFALLYAVKPRAVDAMVDRAVSIQKEGQRGSSLGFRFDENSQALEALTRSPLTGVGMGGEYKRTYRQVGVSGGFETENSFIHNGYLSLWLKLGILGLLFPAVLFFSVLAIGVGVKRKSLGAQQGIYIASAVACVFMMFVSTLTSADWTTIGGNAALATMLAIMLCKTDVASNPSVSKSPVLDSE